MQTIKEPYLLATMCCPCYVDSSGRRYLDPLWIKDLALHTAYIDNLTITVTRIERAPPETFLPLDSSPPLRQVRIVDLPHIKSFLAVLLWLPVLALRLWSAIGQARIVHSGVAGWPIPDGWLTVPLARLRGKFLVVVVESAFWRLSDPKAASFKQKLRAAVSERLNRWCVNAADVAFFTNENYMRTLLTRHPERGHVLHASWIDDEAVLSRSDAAAQWERKLQTAEGLKLLFAGRLIPEKGILTLLEALQSVRARPGAVRLDVLGDGPILHQCTELARQLEGKVEVRFLGVVPYGPTFFTLLSDYDAMVVPSLSSEQPRIVFDAFARAVPVLGFATDGLASCVTSGETGKLCRIDVRELAALIDWASASRDQLRAMGLRSLEAARSYTHREMHSRRSEILARAFAAYNRERGSQAATI